jgi:hypothetical protein
VISFFQVFPPKPCSHLSPPPYALYGAPLIYLDFITRTLLGGGQPTSINCTLHVSKMFVINIVAIVSNLYVITANKCGPEYLSRYSDLLRVGRSGDQIPVWARFSAPVQTGPGVHPASYTMGTGSFPVVKRPGRGVDHTV